jgi:predicted XRE-type DNA-binding protein
MDIQNLLLRLKDSGLTQKQIADAVGCGQSTISDMSTGKIGKSRPSWKVVEGLLSLAERQGLRAAQKPGAPRRRSTDRKKNS